jgi:hypothetical protein
MQVKVKGARKITFDGFVKALDQVAAKKVRVACVCRPIRVRAGVAGDFQVCGLPTTRVTLTTCPRACATHHSAALRPSSTGHY